MILFTSSVVTQSLALEFDVLRQVDEPVHDGVSKSLLGYVVVPSVQGQLRGNKDGFLFIPVLNHLQIITTLFDLLSMIGLSLLFFSF